MDGSVGKRLRGRRNRLKQGKGGGRDGTGHAEGRSSSGRGDRARRRLGAGARPAGVGRRRRRPSPAVRDAFADQYAVPGRVRQPRCPPRGRGRSTWCTCAPRRPAQGPGDHGPSGGAHVVCEKPPVLSLADLDAVLEVAHGVGREDAVVFEQRTGAAVGHVQKLLAEARSDARSSASASCSGTQAGGRRRAAGRGKWATQGGGPPLGLGIHQLDLLGFRLGERAEVDARAFRLDRDLETADTSTAVIRFADDAIVSVLTTALAPRQVSYVRVDTTLGTVEVEHLDGHDARSWRLTPAPSRTGAEPDAAPALWTLPVDDEPSGHTPLLRAVYDAAALRRPAATRRRGPAPVARAGHGHLRVGHPGPPRHQGRPGPGQHPARRLPARRRRPPPGHRMTSTTTQRPHAM